MLWPGALLAAPAAMIVFLGLRNGGFFPDTTAIVALVVLALLLVRVTLEPDAFARQSWVAAIALLALALLAAWTLLSSTWSDATSRAVLEYGRLLLYAGLATLFVSIGRTEARARALVVALAVGFGMLGVLALCPWLLPDDFPVAAAFRRGRLNWPTSYWNATGLIGTFGTLLAVHLACSVRDHPVVRALGAALVPPLVAVVVLSGSRGSVAAGAIGLAVLLATGPSRGMVTGLPVVAVAGGIAALRASGITGLEAADPSAAALDDGQAMAILLVVLAVAAAAARGALGWADVALARARLPRVPRRTAWTVGAVIVALVLVVGAAAGGTGRVTDAWEKFAEPGVVGEGAQAGDRFTQLGNNGRIDIWDVAWRDGWRVESLHGTGAGTFQLLWDRNRPTTQHVLDAHSLELETMAELGVVGIVLLLAALACLIGGLVWRALRDRSAGWAALAAIAVAWAARSAVDWDWEMPVVTAWLFAAGGLALSRPADAAPAHASDGRLGRSLGIIAGLGCLLLALVPLNILRSQGALVDAQRSLRAGDCAGTVSHALTATRTLAARPEAFELLAWCDVRLGQRQLALVAADAAVRRDPGNWELRYTQALVRAVAGRDPRSAARAALRRNPLDARTRDLATRFTADNRRSWRRLALEAPLPLGP
jgi:O-antigen ligase